MLVCECEVCVCWCVSVKCVSVQVCRCVRCRCVSLQVCVHVGIRVCDSLVPRNLKIDLTDYFQEQSGCVVLGSNSTELPYAYFHS